MEPHLVPRSASERVAANVRAELGARRMTHSEFAGLIGWSKATASARLNGERRWYFEDVEAAAALLHMEIEALTAERVA